MNWKKIKSKEKIWNLILKFFKEKKKLNPDYIDISDKNNHIGYLETDSIHEVLRFIPIDDRFLFDFFDAQGILIIIEPEFQYTREIDEDGDNPHYVPEEWGFRIHDLSKLLKTGGPFKNRSKTEETVWLKAFEILENRQNKAGDSNSSN